MDIGAAREMPMGRLILEDANLIDGDAPPRRASVVVSGERIEAIVDGRTAPGPSDRVVPLGGRTVMPGMVLGHYHASYRNLGEVPAPFGLDAPPALQAMRAAANFRLALDCGFTGVISAGAPHGIDAAMKAAIAEGTQVGPRIMACGRDVGTTGHVNDLSFPAHWDVRAQGGVNLCDGPEAFRRGVRQEIKEGSEIIKVFATGGHGTMTPSERWMLSRDELAMVVQTAGERGVKVRAHLANRDAILHSLDIGVHIIDHGDGFDDACIERSLKCGAFLAPSLLFPKAMMTVAPGTPYAESMRPEFEAMAAILPRANAAGVKIILGDDYGAFGFPHGRYAEELELYVKDAGVAPLDVIRWATKNGAEAMGLGAETGTLVAGKLADLLVVDGDPIADISILQDRSRLLAILKGGVAVKDELGAIHAAGMSGGARAPAAALAD